MIERNRIKVKMKMELLEITNEELSSISQEKSEYGLEFIMKNVEHASNEYTIMKYVLKKGENYYSFLKIKYSAAFDNTTYYTEPYRVFLKEKVVKTYSNWAEDSIEKQLINN